MRPCFLLMLFLSFSYHTINAQGFDFSIITNLFKETKEIYYTSDMTMKYEAGEMCAFYEGNRFTGRVYSLDKSCSMSFKNGVATGAVGFFSNGKELFTAEYPFNRTVIWIYNDKGVGLIKAIYEDGEWNYYNRLKPNTENKIPWISTEECIQILRDHYLTLSMIESCLNKLPNIGHYQSMEAHPNVEYHNAGEFLGNIEGYYPSGGLLNKIVELKLYLKIVSNKEIYQIRDANGKYHLVTFGNYRLKNDFNENYSLYNAKAGSYYLNINY